MANDREKILQSAQKFVDKKRYDKAIEEYQKIIKQDPKDARTLLKIGDLQARMQAYADAIATYDKVGQHYSSQGFALKAIAVYKQVRELINKHAPDLADRYAHIVPRLAEIYTQLGLTGDALATYDEVATRHLKNGRDRDAIDVFAKMVELDPQNPLSRVRLAEACCRVQELGRAIDSFWAAAELLLKLNRREDALKVIERILHFRQDPRYARTAAELYLQRRTREDGLQALAKLNICFQANPKDLDTLALLAQAFEVVDAPAKAIEVHKEMARIAREQGRTDLFAQLMTHLKAVAPEDEQVRALMSVPPPADTTSSPSIKRRSASVASVPDAEVEIIEDDALVSVPGAHSRGAFSGAGVPSVDLPSLDPDVTDPPDADFDDDAPDLVVLGDDAPRSQTEEADFEIDAIMQKAVSDAEAFRKLRLYSKAVETLHIALEIDPGVLEVREKLFQVLVDSGDVEGAAHESVNVATVHLNLDDRDSAIQVLHNGLRLLPGNEPALQLLAEIGAPPPPGWGVAEPPRATAPRRGVPDSVGKYSSAALPSYDLEEVSAADVVGTMSFDGVDDPFADLGDMPLPSFPLGEGDSGLGEHPAGAQKRAAPRASADPGYASEAPTRGAPVGYGMPATSGAPVLGAEEEIYEVEPEYPADSDQAFASDAYAAEFASSQANYDAYRASLRPEGEGGAEGIEEILEEAEFFAARGLFEDAKNILVDQLTRTPNHPLVLERLAEVEGALGHPSGSGTIDRSQLEPARKSDRVFDIAASLEALDALDARQTAGRQQFASQHDEVDVEQVFAKFKEGVKKQVADTDSATHYDLGVAYKEMGLLPDAVNEFELAAQDPMRECMCLAMMGMIHLEQNKLDLAEAAYKRGLEARMKTVDQEMSLYYDLGNVMEMKQLPDEALYYFRRIARRDPGFRDVKDRLAALEPKQEPSSRARGGRDEEDFDRAFDELFDNPGAKAAVGKPRR